MTSPGETISAMAASDVAFAYHEVAFGEAFHQIADPIDYADEFVPDSHGHRDRLLGPGIPVIYMYVRPADGGPKDPDQDVVALDLGQGNVL
jgi:hypothetical protein